MGLDHMRLVTCREQGFLAWAPSPMHPPQGARHSQASEQVCFHLCVLGRGLAAGPFSQDAGPFSQDLPDQVFI